MNGISISQIDDKDAFFEINFKADLTVLKKSIQRKGILTPLLIRKKENNHFQIVCGFRRLACAKELGWDEIPAFLSSRRSSLELFEMAMEENSFTRSFNLVEKAMILHKLKHAFIQSKEQILDKYMPILGLEPSEKVVQFYEKLHQAGSALQAFFIEKKLPIHLIEDFFLFDHEEQKELLLFLQNSSWTLAHLKECLLWIVEIMIRDKSSLRSLLYESSFQEILNSSLDSKVKFQKIKFFLKLKRYPVLSKMEIKVNQLKKELNIPLEIPNFFEGNRLQLKFSFESKKELEQITQKLNHALHQKKLEELLEMI